MTYNNISINNKKEYLNRKKNWTEFFWNLLGYNYVFEFDVN